MKRKFIFLFLALLLPASVFIFLKMFGRNEFQVPVIHEEGSIKAPSHCDAVYATPYRLADSVFSLLDLNRNDSLFVLYFDASHGTAIQRAMSSFRDAPVDAVFVGTVGGMDLRYFRDCVLLVPADSSVALVDHRRRIRGYYDGADRDEVDRLIVEMKIILKQF